MTSCFCFASEKVFVYEVTLTFKVNCVNIIFDNKKKALDCLCGTMYFGLKLPVPTQQLRAASRVCQVNNSPGHCSREQCLHYLLDRVRPGKKKLFF